MKTTQIKMDSLVIVATEGGKPGIVKYITASGTYGVALVNEKGRIDEWHPTQVRACTTKEAAKASLKFVA